MSYFKTNPYTFAREIADQIGGVLYSAGSLEDPELPDPNNFTTGSVLVHFDEVYVHNGNSWIKLTNNRYNPNGLYNYEYEVKHEIEEETDTALWLALLED